MTSNRDEGALLWFDDDIKRPLQQKILDGVERYRERMGYEPTQVHLNPAQAKALEEAMQAPAKKRGEPLRLPCRSYACVCCPPNPCVRTTS